MPTSAWSPCTTCPLLCPFHQKLSSRLSHHRATFQTWMQDVGKQGDNPFWASGFDEEPLDPEKPVVDITLLPFVGRFATENYDVVLTSSDKVLYQGKLKNGRLRGAVDPEVAKLSNWKAPLTLRKGN